MSFLVSVRRSPLGKAPSFPVGVLGFGWNARFQNNFRPMLTKSLTKAQNSALILSLLNSPLKAQPLDATICGRE
jgi:hypothetical protein